MTFRKLPPLDARILEWDFNDLIQRSCPICSLPSAHPVCERPDGLYVRSCKQCHTYYVSPSPSQRQLNKFYENYDLNHRPGPRIDSNELLASYKHMDPLSDIRIRELSSLMRFDGSKVLDVGFGRASFLYYLKRLGAIPFGLELDTQAIEFAKSLGITTFRGDLRDFASEAKYKMISLLDFVEHPLSPMDALRQASELLEKGGLLVIWTPNGDFASLEENPTTFRVDLEHMQYLSPSTLIFIASQLKLNVVHLETLGFHWLMEINKPLTKNKTPSSFIKRKIESIPGITMMNKLGHVLIRKKIHQKKINERKFERTGSYHLFCIMEKSCLKSLST